MPASSAASEDNTALCTRCGGSSTVEENISERWHVVAVDEA